MPILSGSSPRSLVALTAKNGKLLKTFKAMNLFAPINRALTDEKYTQPTPIQSQTIVPAMDGQDILGCAQTGTGKTAAFALPILDYIGREEIRPAPNRPVALVLAPTRELAIQIGDSFRVYGKHMRISSVLVYGGVNQNPQVKALRKGVDILVATPGRLQDLMEQRHIDLRDVEIFVLDEADRMLDMGFLPALKKIIAKLPKERQSMFFSATMPPNIRKLSQELLYKPISVDVTPKSSSVKSIEQSIKLVERSNKVNLLRDILTGPDVERTIVFTRTKHGANALVRKLDRVKIRAAAIHGNKSQNARQKALEAFRRNDVSVLVATDVAARGIDIAGVSHVINFDMPAEAESYVHRIGRTGRAGAEGLAISFCTPQERDLLTAIEKLIDMKIRVSSRDPGFDENAPTSMPKRGARGGGRRGGSKNQSRNRKSGSRKSSGSKGSKNTSRANARAGKGKSKQSSGGRGRRR